MLSGLPQRITMPLGELCSSEYNDSTYSRQILWQVFPATWMHSPAEGPTGPECSHLKEISTSWLNWEKASVATCGDILTPLYLSLELLLNWNLKNPVKHFFFFIFQVLLSPHGADASYLGMKWLWYTKIEYFILRNFKKSEIVSFCFITNIHLKQLNN